MDEPIEEEIASIDHSLFDHWFYRNYGLIKIGISANGASQNAANLKGQGVGFKITVPADMAIMERIVPSRGVAEERTIEFKLTKEDAILITRLLIRLTQMEKGE